MKKSEYNYNIGLYRVILTLLVIIGHAFIIDNTVIENVTGNVYSLQVIDQIKYIIYQFHMPAYMMLTGFLWYTYNIKGDAIKKRKKLLKLTGIYILVQLIAVYPFEYLAGKVQQYSIGEYIINQIYDGEHVWYIASFLIYWLITSQIMKLFKSKWIYASGILVVITQILQISGITGDRIRVVSKQIDFYIWFILGVLLAYATEHNTLYEPYRLQEKLGDIHKLLDHNIALLVQTTIWLLQTIPNYGQTQVELLVTGIPGQLTLYILCIRINSEYKSERFKKLIKQLDSCNFSVYILQYIIHLYWNLIWYKYIAQYIMLEYPEGSGKYQNFLMWDSSCVINLPLTSLALQLSLWAILVYIDEKRKGRCKSGKAEKQIENKAIIERT